jgi:beta-galactosidase
MATSLFTSDWTFRRLDGGNSIPVRLPHDAMIGEPRSADASTGNHGGYFPGGAYSYSKQWRVPMDAEYMQYRLLFEGVYGDTVVALDGREIARCNSGYRAFVVPLDALVPGSSVAIEVTVDNTRTPNSRWYTGTGIYRPVWLEAVRATHFARDGIRLVTRSLTPNATVDIDVCIEGPAAGHTVRVELADNSGPIAARRARFRYPRHAPGP